MFDAMVIFASALPAICFTIFNRFLVRRGMRGSNAAHRQQEENYEK